MNRTKIEWVLNPDGTPGFTWNPITGCLNHTDGLCKGGGFPCYAYKLANGRLKERYLEQRCIGDRRDGSGWPWPKNAYAEPSDEYIKAFNDPFYPRFWEEKLFDPMKQRKTPKGIFVCDMSDLFGIGVPEIWTDHIMTTIKCCPQHRFYLLTKQPQNLIKFSPFPDNCWVGVTVTGGGLLLSALDALDDIQCKIRFLSFEPLLTNFSHTDLGFLGGTVDWVIIGAQTLPYKPPRWGWVEDILKAAKQAGIPVFLKNNLGAMDMRGEWDRELWLGENLCLRQEMLS